MAAHLHAGRELAFGDGAHQAFVAGAKSVFHRQLQRGAVTHGLAIQRGFNLGENVFITPVEVGHVASVQRFALGGGHLVGDGDGGVFGDVHFGVASVLQRRALSVKRSVARWEYKEKMSLTLDWQGLTAIKLNM